MNNEFKHYGVLGMKWGVRKDQNHNSKYFDKHAKIPDTINKKGERKINREIRKAKRNSQLKDYYVSTVKEADSIYDKGFKDRYDTAQAKINSIHNKKNNRGL